MLGPHWYRCCRADTLALIDRGHALPALKAVAEVTVGRTLHDGLRPRELDDRRADLGNVIVKVADQERA